MFINTYRQATHLEDPQLRMIHTIQTAGKATFFTSLTTAAAYAANVFSQVGSLPQIPVLASCLPTCGRLLTPAPSSQGPCCDSEVHLCDPIPKPTSGAVTTVLLVVGARK